MNDNAEHSDGEDVTSDNDISSLLCANLSTTVATASHTLLSRSSEVSRSDADGVLHTVVGSAGELSASTAQSLTQRQNKVDGSRRKSIQRVRTTRCHMCVNCLSADCGKCYSCRSVQLCVISYHIWINNLVFLGHSFPFLCLLESVVIWDYSSLLRCPLAAVGNVRQPSAADALLCSLRTCWLEKIFRQSNFCQPCVSYTIQACVSWRNSWLCSVNRRPVSVDRLQYLVVFSTGWLLVMAQHCFMFIAKL